MISIYCTVVAGCVLLACWSDRMFTLQPAHCRVLLSTLEWKQFLSSSPQDPSRSLKSKSFVKTWAAKIKHQFSVKQTSQQCFSKTTMNSDLRLWWTGLFGQLILSLVKHDIVLCPDVWWWWSNVSIRKLFSSDVSGWTGSDLNFIPDVSVLFLSD